MWRREHKKKVIEPKDLGSKIKGIRSRGQTIATLNGSFDLLHAGHLHIIFEASKQADCLIVALNSDASIKLYKSESRPLIPLEYRIEMISALEFVDYVTWFDETDPREILKIIQPDVHVNGADYKDGCIEESVVSHVHYVDLIPGLSTSQIVDQIAKGQTS